jgi:hypothetical protein
VYARLHLSFGVNAAEDVSTSALGGVSRLLRVPRT